MRQLSHTHTREYARGPDSSHAGPMVCMWATSPTCMSSGLRAYHGVNTHVQGLRCEQHTTSNIVVPKTQTTQPTAAHFQQLSSNGPALWGITPPRTAISQVPDGGNYAIQASDTPATRRQRASHGAKPPPPPVWRAPSCFQDRHSADWREKTRPARPLQRLFREKTRPARAKTPNSGCLKHAGRTISCFPDDTGPRGELCAPK